FKREKRPPLPKNTTKTVYPELTLKPASSNRITHLLWLLSNGTFSVKPLLMESLKQTYHGSAYRGESGQNLPLPYIGKNGTLYILVENRGYVNYGSELSADRKGLMYPVYLDDHLLENWIMYPLCFNKDGLSCPTTNILDKLTQYPNEWSFARLREMPRMGLVYRGSMEIESPDKLADTFIQLDSFQRGLLYVNSILLGRFDQLRGPQITMFLPKPFLRVGTNGIVVVELSDTVIDGRISFSDKPIWL
ncbi:hypothetical protein FGIG_05349, partial [Fasciola gigantica]